MLHDGSSARRAAIAAALTALLSAAPGGAQPLDETQRRAVAQALFDEAQKLMESNNYSVACIKLEEVVRLQPGKIGALLTLARCYEAEGKTASAWSRYKNSAEAAKVSRDPRQAEAEKKVAELEKKVPRLAITVAEKTGALVGLRVTRDGTDVSAAQWGVAIPMDPGDHHIEVTAPGKKVWTDDATLADGRLTTVEVPELAVDGPEAPAATATATAPMTATATATARPTAMSDAPSTGKILGLERGTWGLIIGGVGAAGLVAGGVTGGLALGQHDALAAACPNGQCPPGKRGDVDAYELLGTLSTVGFIAGGVLAAAGVTVWLTAPKAKTSGVMLAPYAGPLGAGVTGRF